MTAAVRRSLRETFGIRHLREGQQEVIERVLCGRDTLAIMPTGAGKSLCYQLPALHLDGLTVVVSPLIALMKDQAEKLGEAGVAAEQLNSARSAAEQAEALARLGDESSEIVFVTPERLADAAFRETLGRRSVALLVVDEAHCISQWGHDFRPAYLEIGAALELLGKPPVLALTATATDDVIEDIRERLGRPTMHVVNTGIYRDNLRFAVAQCVREDEKHERLAALLAGLPGATIVYTATVKACEALHARLEAAGESATRYHGRLPTAERHANQERFMRGEARIVVATNAFGMGIDKADIRNVIHWQMPGSLEAYYQEAGRAGRDGEPADCALLFWRRDRQVQQFFIARAEPELDELEAVFAALRGLDAPVAVADLARRAPGVARARLGAALAVLRDGGLAKADRQRRWQATRGRDADRAALAGLAAEREARGEREHEALERMVFYAQTGFCRWRVLLEAFDEPLPFDGGRCGRCDNCRRAERAASEPPAEPQEPPPEASPHAAFAAGDAVRVPRYGEGVVEGASGEEVEVRFADGRRRSFVAAYVKRA